MNPVVIKNAAAIQRELESTRRTSDRQQLLKQLWRLHNAESAEDETVE